jgi:hypothetical protein
MTQRVASKIDHVLGGATEGLFEHEDLGEPGEALRISSSASPSENIVGDSTTAWRVAQLDVAVLGEVAEAFERFVGAAVLAHLDDALAWPITSRDTSASCSCSMTACAFAYARALATATDAGGMNLRPITSSVSSKGRFWEYKFSTPPVP